MTLYCIRLQDLKIEGGCDVAGNQEVGIMILRCGIAVDDHELVPVKEARETGRGVDYERSAADDEHVRMGNCIHRTVDHVVVERLLIENDIGLDLATPCASSCSRAIIHAAS